MGIIQEIGSYAGLAAVLGLAVLSALYFSQARDVRRLREWAGRAPERAPQPQPQRVVAKPVPKPPAALRPATPAATPKPATAQASAAGAAPAVATGPAAATPAAARAADAGQTREEAEKTATDGAGGTDENGALAQDTAVHRPPADGEERDHGAEPDDGEEKDEGTGEGEAERLDDGGEPGDDGGEPEEDGEEREGGVGDYEEDEGEGEDEAEDEDFEDTGDEPALTPPPPIPPIPPSRPTVPIGASGRDPAPVRRSQTAIIPPYEESRPGGPVPARAGLFSTPRRAVLVVGGTLVAIAVIGFGALQLTGNDKGGGATKKKGPAAAPQLIEQPKKKRKSGINPASVRVAVLNGTTVPGLAAQIGDSIDRQGFQLGTVTNFVDQQRAESVVLFAPGAEREAADVGKRLKIAQREPIDAESQGIAGDATVVVVAGADKTQ